MLGDYDIDVLGGVDLSRRRTRARRPVVGEIGDGVPMWDNRTSFSYGDLVRHNERYWKATRDVFPALFPSLMSGEVPGDSDAWKPVGASAVREQMHGDFVPDSPAALARERAVNARSKQFATLRQVPVAVARVILKGGLGAIGAAKLLANANSLPGGTNRDEVSGHLQWHVDHLPASLKPESFYTSGDDLKKWVLAAYAEWDAAADGAEAVGRNWDQLWADVGEALAKLPKAVVDAVTAAGKAVGDAASSAVKTTLIAVGVGVGIIGGGVLFVRSMARR